MSRLLVVNADDMGLTAGVCRAVRRGHADGVVTSTSVLAVGTAFDEAAATVREAGDLALGAHLAIVGEDRPLLSAAEIPTLVDREGRFPLSYRTVVARGAAGRLDPADVAREFGALPLPLPAGPARRAARAVARLPLLPPSVGWVEALSHPAIMDTTKARTLLGWRPRYTGLQALRGTLDR